jgi:4-amino-4-deoxy-L-arabinose transferase-like glycosyltransferase
VERRFWLAAGLMLALMGAMMVHSAAGECQTFDEATHLAAGASYWTTWDFRLNPEHPPLVKLLAAAPALIAGAQFNTDSAEWRTPNQLEAGSQFLYHNRLEPDTILMLARLPIMVLTLGLGLAILLWARAKAGAAAALVALGLFVLDSNFIAHGHYITTDAGVSLFLFLSVIAWIAYCESERWLNLGLAALAFGLAAGTKFSALVLFPVLAAIAAGYSFPRKKWKPLAGLPLLLLGAALVVGALYGKHSVQAFLADPRKPLATLRDNHRYVSGVMALFEHNEAGHNSYLLGKKRNSGHWAYFLVAFGVKTPLAALLLLPFVWLAFRGKDRTRAWAFLFFIAVYLSVSMASNINIGHRHILPIYPFLYAMTAAEVVSLKRWRAAVIAAAALIQIVEVARIHPHHLAYFHALAGGPEAAPRYLLDSNVDWGQDLKHLRRYLDEQRAENVYFRYFGLADWSRYGFAKHLGLPAVWEPSEIAKIDGWVAISVTDLYDVYYDKPTFSWLLKYEPTARVGYSFYVYDLRKSKP